MAETTRNAAPALLQLNPADNIAVLLRGVVAGSLQAVDGREIVLGSTLPMGQKVAILPIPAGAEVLKYGLPIGVARCDIAVGDHVHLHNIESRYTVIRDWEAST
ncbi:UxaA family hydrolase [Tropicimonas sp.]|uniref:UxaA family hydrolase n=1 Tax=Tropicimonas sp. TaxID=2067044 RepID=UPI003A89032F